MRNVRPADTGAVRNVLHRVFLHQYPSVAVVLESPDEFVENVGVVGQRHLGRRKPSDALERLQAEDRRKMMPPGRHVQAEILHGCRWCHSVAPCCTEPLDRAPVSGIECNPVEIIEDVIQAHGPEPVQEAARVIQHHSGLFTFVNKLRHKLAHTFVAPMENGRIVVVADALVVHHVFKIADDRCRPQIGASGRDQGLVHVECDVESASNPAEIDAGLPEVMRTRAGCCLGNPFFRATDVRYSIDVFR